MDLLPSMPHAAWWALLGGAVGLAWWAHTRTRRANARRGAFAKEAEARAERLLVSQGYKVVARQRTGRWTIWVDGAPHEVTCRADLIVRKRRRTYVAEVKSSGHHTDPTHPHTRRQLLAYTHAFEAHGVLLVDMARGRITEVRFHPS